MLNPTVSLAIAGFGGSGVVAAGQILLTAASRLGYYGLAQRSFGPQIRGGESLSLLRLGSQPIGNQDDRFGVVVLLDNEKVERFKDELPINAASLVIVDAGNGEAPAFLQNTGAQVIALPLSEQAKQFEQGKQNMVATGLLASLLGLPEDVCQQVIQQQLGKKGSEVVSDAEACFACGMALSQSIQFEGIKLPELNNDSEQTTARWLSNGNDLAGYGALHCGIRFVAAYPITPASGALEWLAPNIEKVGGELVQAEDELASINMTIGASFGGIPSMTATSGPGLALMTESIGLAVASETPLVVLNVMRGGPSTGIPTKSEQTDLNIALHGLHGEAPHLVLAALSIADCAFTTGWATWLAEDLQVPAIVLSDQAMAQSDASIAPPVLWSEKAQRLVAAGSDTPYDRYALTDTGISPMAIPGEEDMMYTADGLEHNPHGTPSSSAHDHQQQLDKRANKLSEFDYGKHWAEISGQGDTLILSWGSVSCVAEEAAMRLSQTGIACKSVSLRLLAPLQTEQLNDLLEHAKRVIVVEQSHSGQLLAWIRSHITINTPVLSLAQPGPLPIRPGTIVSAVQNWNENQVETQHAANC